MTGFGDKKSDHISPENAELYRGSHCYYPPPPPPLLSPANPIQSSHSGNNNNNVSDSDYYKSAVLDSMYQHDLRAPYYPPPPVTPHHSMSGFQYYGSYGGGPPVDGRSLLNAPLPSAVASTSTSQSHMAMEVMERHPIDYYGHSAAAAILAERRDSDPDDPAWYYQQPQEHMTNMTYTNNRYPISFQIFFKSVSVSV